MRRPPGGTPGSVAPRQRGFVLLIVLWTVGLLALIGAHITANARSAAEQATSLRAAAVAAATADGLVHEAIFHLLDRSERRWAADGVVHRIVLARGSGEVVVSNEAGRINPTSATIQTLTAMLGRLGVSAEQARLLATAIYEWHVAGGANPAAYSAAHLPYLPPASQFLDVDELLLIPGMTPDLLARLDPHLSVYNDGYLDVTQADPLVIQVIQTLNATQRPQAPEPGAPLVARISAWARLPDGEARREVVVRIDPGAADPATFVQILAWRTPRPA